MAKEQLVDTDIKAGAELVQALLHSDFQLEAAYWEDRADANDWRRVSAWKLVLATPLIQDKGPMYAISHLRELARTLDLSPDARSVTEHATIISPNHARLAAVPAASRNTWVSGLYVYHFAPKTFFSNADQLDRSVLSR